MSPDNEVPSSEPSVAGHSELLKDKLFALLPVDGTSLSNTELRRRLGVPAPEYWRARDVLVDEGRATRGRGRGGSTARVLEELDSEVVHFEPGLGVAPGAGGPPRLTEAQLYAPLQGVLSGDWQADKGIEYLAVEDVARAGSRSTGGKWTRPDLVGVDVQVLTYLPTKTLSVHTFEVKPSDAIDVTAVYEALAHRRAATHAYVMLHVPDEASPPAALESVVLEARRHGIGVIVFADPDNYETWDERVVADRVEPEPSAIDEFIRVQMPEAARLRIEKAVR